eukprot:2378293-Karenia_brevis.AAC.1
MEQSCPKGREATGRGGVSPGVASGLGKGMLTALPAESMQRSLMTLRSIACVQGLGGLDNSLKNIDHLEEGPSPCLRDHRPLLEFPSIISKIQTQGLLLRKC